MVEIPEGKRPLGRPKRRRGKILKWIFRKWDADMNWIDVAQDKDRWRVVVIALVNLFFPVKCGEFLDWPRTC